MIHLQNVQTISGSRTDIHIPSLQDETINVEHLLLFPGLIDPHVHFRVPGQEYKENWRTAARASIRGGYTTVFDMPNNIPACVTENRLHEKKRIIETQLNEAQIPLNYQLWFGADKNNFDQIHLVKDQIIGVKVFMGSSTGDLLMDDDSSLHAIFSIAAHLNLMVAVHAEDECSIQANQIKYANETDFAVHSKIRDPEVAARAVEKAISLVRLYGTRLYILHVSTRQELMQIRQAKKEGLPVYAEATPHHLFLDDTAYAKLKGRAQMNPPLRDQHQQQALWEALLDGTIDTIGSDHAPHTCAEKDLSYRQVPSGVPGIETNLPLLLNAYHQKRISLERIKQLTHDRICEIFKMAPKTNNYVLIDMEKQKCVLNEALATQCQWSPFNGMLLQGWPAMTVINDKYYRFSE